jgi:hypothetical protein
MAKGPRLNLEFYSVVLIAFRDVLAFSTVLFSDDRRRQHNKKKLQKCLAKYLAAGSRIRGKLEVEVTLFGIISPRRKIINSKYILAYKTA